MADIGYSSLKGSYWSGGTSLTGFLAVYKVAYKKPFNVYKHTPEYKLFTKENVHRLGADAIFASKDQGMLVNDEVVVYDDKQATIRYLIELA
jgi:poly [ADP-ribose] polymerase